MIGATGGSKNSEEESMTMLKMAENFLEKFNENIQYVTQEFESTILGSKPVSSGDNNIKINFDLIIERLNSFKLNQSISKAAKKKEKESDDSYKIILSMSDSLQSATDEIKEVVANKLENSKKNYQGEMQNNLRNGFGIYVYENKFFRYEGEWKNGRKHGIGKLVMRDGSYYEGEFKNGEIVGKGYKYNKSKESEYTGDFLEGLQHGKGTLRVRKSHTYQGDFYENMRHGYGELNEFKVTKNYQGQWYYNKRHGQGIQRYSDGSTYTGDWIRDKRQGHGEMEFLDGSYYDGQWRGDIINGKGIYKHFTGYAYDGLFSNGLPNKLTSTKLAISIEKLPELDEQCIKIEANTRLKVVVKTVDDSNETFIEDGRKIILTMGIKIDVGNTTKYVDQVATEFGFSIIPVAFENNTDLKLRSESAIIDVTLNDGKLIAVSSTNEQEFINNLKSEKLQENKEQTLLENSQYMVDSYSSKIPECVMSNENGSAIFESFLVEKIRLPLKEGETKSESKDTNLGPNKGSYNCVIIAEDYTRPIILGHKPKSTYLECIVNNSDAKIPTINNNKKSIEETSFVSEKSNLTSRNHDN